MADREHDDTDHKWTISALSSVSRGEGCGLPAERRVRWLAVTNKNQCPSSPRAPGRHPHLHQTFPTTTAATGDIITSWGAGTGQSVARCLGVSLHLIEIQECVGRRVEEEVPTCHTGLLLTPALQSADTVSDIVILSTRWTAAAAASELLVVAWTGLRTAPRVDP